MSVWGNDLNKKKIKTILESGTKYLGNKINEINEENIDSMWKDYNNLWNLLYNGEGRTLMSITDKAKY